MDQYSSGCRYDFEATAKPDLVKWSKVNITYPTSINYTGQLIVQKSDFCPTQQQNLTEVVPMTFVTYDAAFQQCWILNGKMPLLQNGSALLEEVHLKKVLELEKSTCTSGYWLPIVKSKTNATKWILDVRDGSPETEVNVLSGSQNRLDGKGSCMILASDTLEYRATYCTESRGCCSLCQMDQKRLLFSLKEICDEKAGIDTDYFLIKDPVNPEFIFFSGLTGLTNIKNDFSVWKIIFNSEKNESLNTWAIFNGTNQLPIGLATWYLTSPCNNSLKNVLKFTNVSNLLAYVKALLHIPFPNSFSALYCIFEELILVWSTS